MKKLLIILALTSCSTQKPLKVVLYKEGNVIKIEKNLDGLERWLKFDYVNEQISPRCYKNYTMFIEHTRNLLQTNNEQ
jgi:hypothetical protein